MRRKITVYGLRFSKTSFWNRLNTGFPDPAVATVLTACGIETTIKLVCVTIYKGCNSTYRLRYWNINRNIDGVIMIFICCNSTYRLRYWNPYVQQMLQYGLLYELQQYLPLAVLKHDYTHEIVLIIWELQQYLPLAVLKPVLTSLKPKPS